MHLLASAQIEVAITGDHMFQTNITGGSKPTDKYPNRYGFVSNDELHNLE